MNLSLSRSNSVSGRASWLDAELERTMVEIAKALEPREGEIDMILVGDEEIRELNREFRGIDKPTDVITFNYSGNDPHPQAANLIGEVYISHQTLEKEASDQAIDLKHLFLRIGVHGLLHAQGYDHDTEEDASRMEAEERRLLSEYLAAGDVEALF